MAEPMVVALFSLLNTDGTGYKDLMDFTGTTTGIGYPEGSLTVSGNVLYGMTYYGGAKDSGVVFSINTDGTGFQKLLDFTGSNGAHPSGSLVLSGNVLYGTTAYGGTHGYGVVFSVHTDGTGYQKLLDFNNTNGRGPVGDLVLSGNVLYGVTDEGGTNGEGLIYSIQTDGTGYKDIMEYNDATGGPYSPEAGLVLSGGALYGMTFGGGTYDYGILYSVKTDGTNYKDLFDFNDDNNIGKWPKGGLTVSGTTLYGMTYEGGANDDGVVFSYNTLGLGIAPVNTPAAAKVLLYPNPASSNFRLLCRKQLPAVSLCMMCWATKYCCKTSAMPIVPLSMLKTCQRVFTWYV